MKLKRIFIVITLLIITVATYSQTDSLAKEIIYSWKLNQNDFSREFVKVDTSLESFQNFNALLESTVLPNYLGNLGSASQPKIYFEREKYNTGFIFSQPYGIYFKFPANQQFYNTKRQFTLLSYSNSGRKEESEQMLGVLHTQNINENFNIGVDYDMISSDGRYQNQQVRQNKINLFSSYIGKRYQIHTSFNLNRVKAQENGGIDSLSYLGSDKYRDRKNIPVKLEDASSQIFNTGLYLAQEYQLGKKVIEIRETTITNSLIEDSKQSAKKKSKPMVDSVSIENQDSLFISDPSTVLFSKDSVLKTIDTLRVYKVTGFSLSHELVYNGDIRKFMDNDITDGSGNFYSNLDIFIDSTKTREDIRQKQLGNKIALQFKKNDVFSSKVSFYNELVRYYFEDTTYVPNILLEDSVIRTDANKSIWSNAVSVSLKANISKRLRFSAAVMYFISGYKKENSEISFNTTYSLFKNTYIGLKANYKNFRPDYYYEHYTSNNFIWNKSYLGRIEKWNSEFLVQNRRINFSAGVKYGEITNYIYLDNTANVNQNVGKINLLSLSVTENLKIGPVHSLTKFVYQKSSRDSILSLPEFNLYQSLYYEHLTKFKSTDGELLWQFGIDYRYSSSYYADGYMPVSGLFHRQYDQKLPDFHCFDIFANLKIKRARFYLKYTYLNSVISNSYYFAGPYYPVPQPAFKFGLAWTFQD